MLRLAQFLASVSGLHTNFLLYYIQRKIFFRRSFFLYSPCHYMRAWIRILDVPGCYERVARAERKSALQGSGLVRTVGPCAQGRVALMQLQLETHCRTIDRRESTTRFERPAKRARSVLYHIPVSSLVATFEQSANVAIAHLVGAAYYEGCGLCNCFHLRMRTVPMSNLTQAGYCLCVKYVYVL